MLISYTAPTITSVSPLSASTSGGDTLTITGTNLGQFGSATILVGTVSCKLLSGFEQTSMRCTIPQGMGTGLGVTVTVASQATTSIGANLFSYFAPSIDTVSPSSGSTAGSTSSQDSLTITGTSFGQVCARVFVTYAVLSATFVVPFKSFLRNIFFGFICSPSRELLAASRSVTLSRASFKRGSTRKLHVVFRRAAAAT
jgi:hypothetical protein